MAVLVTDPVLAGRLKAEREASGAGRFDEVWESVYMMTPMPNDEHQRIVMLLGSILQEVIGWPGLGDVRPGVNVSQSEEGWETNYRVPDLAVFLRGGTAKNCGTFWCGGPDFGVEIVSPDDRTREKLPFYGTIGVRELLLIDRDPWALELYRSASGSLRLAVRASLEQMSVITSQVVPLDFRLTPGVERPSIEVALRDHSRQWRI
jgi:Uma2 family endonuclease